MWSLFCEVRKMMLASNVAIPPGADLAAECTDPSTYAEEIFYDATRLCIIALSEEKHVFMLIDEFQEWFDQPRNGYPEEIALRSMRRMFKYMLIDPDAQQAHFVITGSMGSGWVQIRRCPTNGSMLSNAFRVNLPARVDEDMYQSVISDLKGRIGCSPSIVDAVASYCDRNHALLAFLLEEFVAQYPEGVPVTSDVDVREFCLKEIGKIIMEIGASDVPVLQDLRRGSYFTS